jgi:hypothetical protein
MHTNIITRHIGIGLLAFCATFVQTSIFAASHFGGAGNTQAVHAHEARIAQTVNALSDAASPRA